MVAFGSITRVFAEKLLHFNNLFRFRSIDDEFRGKSIKLFVWFHVIPSQTIRFFPIQTQIVYISNEPHWKDDRFESTLIKIPIQHRNYNFIIFPQNLLKYCRTSCISLYGVHKIFSVIGHLFKQWDFDKKRSVLCSNDCHWKSLIVYLQLIWAHFWRLNINQIHQRLHDGHRTQSNSYRFFGRKN